MFSNKKERLALCIAACIFGLVGIVQLWRAFAQIPVVFGAQSIPVWISFVIGLAAISMAFWLGNILLRHRPLV